MILTWTCAILLTLPLASEGPSDPDQILTEELNEPPALRLGDDAPKVAVDGFLRATRIDTSGSSSIPAAALGTKIDHARLRLGGTLDDFSWRVGIDALNDELSVQDAWISSDSILDDTLDAELTLGRFRAPFLSSSLLDADRLLFPVRTRNGVFYSVRSPGVSAEGTSGDLGWAVAVQDGILDPSDLLTTLRFTYDFTGLGALPWEGALRSDFKSRFWVAAAVSKEDRLESDLARALELHYVNDRYSLALEWLGYGNDYDIEGGEWGPDSELDLRGERRGGTHPLSITGTYMFVPDRVELAVRLEDFDDNRGDGFYTNDINGVEADTDFDRKNLYVGLNYYVDGHDMKFHLGQLKESRDGIDDSDDTTFWGVGMSLSF
jgi:hypothetical protein